MPSYVPAKNGSELIYYVSLIDQSNTLKFKVNPTIAAGDFKVVADDGALVNLATLPVVSPAGSTRVKIVVSAAESVGDNVSVIGIDAAGDEWADIEIPVQTTAQQIDDLSTFDPALDAVANVTLVGTCTTNTDMRGTDGANTTAPDNAGISANGVAIAAVPADVWAEPTRTLTGGFIKNTAYGNFKLDMKTSSGLPATGLTITGMVNKDEELTFTTITGTITEASLGAYNVDFSANDLNGDKVIIKFTAPGALTETIFIQTDA